MSLTLSSAPRESSLSTSRIRSSGFESEQRFVTLKVTCKGIRHIEKNGLESVLRDAQKKGFINLV